MGWPQKQHLTRSVILSCHPNHAPSLYKQIFLITAGLIPHHLVPTLITSPFASVLPHGFRLHEHHPGFIISYIESIDHTTKPTSLQSGAALAHLNKCPIQKLIFTKAINMPQQERPSYIEDPDKALAGFIYDYLLKKNHVSAAAAFIVEAQVNTHDIIVSMSPGECFLKDWFTPFWALYISRNKPGAAKDPKVQNYLETTMQLAPEFPYGYLFEDSFYDESSPSSGKNKRLPTSGLKGSAPKKANSSDHSLAATPKQTAPQPFHTPSSTTRMEPIPGPGNQAPSAGGPPMINMMHARPPTNISLPPNSMAIQNWPGNQQPSHPGQGPTGSASLPPPAAAAADVDASTGCQATTARRDPASPAAYAAAAASDAKPAATDDAAATHGSAAASGVNALGPERHAFFFPAGVCFGNAAANAKPIQSPGWSHDYARRSRPDADADSAAASILGSAKYAPAYVYSSRIASRNAARDASRDAPGDAARFPDDDAATAGPPQHDAPQHALSKP
ncbi:hypothetical protein DSO57_1025295 [Entomophthora muscae]|uniref:Uncharacterized protein n=1 Tax=Entomophthora muscae TaxID=34485 RepID=A0ACC2RH02_9FUNG|nr:hypothetical protein DSO57_1025295 [Entomophthora muscae]